MTRLIRPLFILALLLGLAAPAQRTAEAATTHTLTIKTDKVVSPVSPLMLGSNAPSWLGDVRYQDSTFRNRTKYSGLKTLRIPGGSWGDLYGWLSCEQRVFQVGKAYQCGGGGDWSSWIARPTDYINFLRASKSQAVYILNVNATAQEAAALVAFFNGDPADKRVIGVDRNGQDWATVGAWAQLRVDHGNANPFYIRYWDFGNEVYGATQAAGGGGCASWGWENAWTCDGATYINGDANHDGYKQVRDAMQAVDPSVLVGAVGIENVADYNNWGVKVLQEAGSFMDYYVIHPYPYGTPPANTADGWAQILAKPREQWPTLRANLRSAFNAYAGGRRIPIAANEFNLVYSHDLDYQQMMRAAGNMLFLAESIGQAIFNRYFMFDQWSLSNGCSGATNSCYDMLAADNAFERAPQYYAFTFWSRFGRKMLRLRSDAAINRLSAYAGRIDAQTYSVLAINKTGSPIRAKVKFSDGRKATGGTANVVRAESLNATSVIYNERMNTRDKLARVPALGLPINANGVPVYDFPPYSVTLLRITAP